MSLTRLNHFALWFVSGLIAFAIWTGCGSASAKVLETEHGQVELRSIQSRVYDTSDKIFLLHAIMATMQDLGFVIDDANDVIGTVSGTKMDRYAVEMTVSVRMRGESQYVVRANAEYNRAAVTDAQPYQDFFNALSKSLFLTAHELE